MKKIILLLTFIFNLSFADFSGSGQCPQCVDLDLGSGLYAKLDNLTYTNTLYNYGTKDTYFVRTNGTSSYCQYYTSNQLSDTNTKLHIYHYTYTYTYGQKCPAPAPTCTENEELVDGQCVCKSGYTYDPSVEECVYNCSFPSSYSPPLGYEYFVNVYNSPQDCINYALTLGENINTNFQVLSPDSSHPECSFNICEVDRYVVQPCQSMNPVVVPDASYIFKGLTSNEVECEAFVLNNPDKYLNYKTSLQYDNCPSKTSVYCFLRPAYLNNEPSSSIPESNSSNTYPDGTLSNETPIPSASSDLNQSTAPYDSVARSNALLQALTGDFKKYYEWQKVSQNGWVKSLTEDGRQLLKELEKNRGADINGSKNIVNAVNGLGGNIDGVKNAVNAQGQAIVDKLQELVDKNSSINVDKFFEEDYDTNGTGYELVDINVSLDTGFFDGLLSNFTTAYQNMNNDLSTLSQNANDLISMLETEKETAFNISLPRATVTTCPYTSVLDLGFQTLDIEIDICKVVNPLYSIFYLVFSIIFSSIIVIFGFNALMKLGN